MGKRRKRNIKISTRGDQEPERITAPPRDSRVSRGSSPTYQPYPGSVERERRQLRPGRMASDYTLNYEDPQSWVHREAAIEGLIEGHRTYASDIVADFVDLLTTEIKVLDRPGEVSNQDVIATYLDKATSTLSNWKSGYRSRKIRGETEKVESIADFPSLLIMKILIIAMRDPKRLYKIFFQKDMNASSHIEELVRAYSQGESAERCASLAQLVAASFNNPAFEKHSLDILEDIIQAPVVEQ